MVGAWQAWEPFCALMPASLDTVQTEFEPALQAGDTTSKGMSAKMNCCIQEKEDPARQVWVGGDRRRLGGPAKELVFYSLNNSTGSELKKEEKGSIWERGKGRFKAVPVGVYLGGTAKAEAGSRMFRQSSEPRPEACATSWGSEDNGPGLP